nr:T9SS type A sorting domain-containing protein [Flavobacteriales bacterium]
NGSVYFQTMGNNGPSPQAGLAFGNNEIVMAGCNSGGNGSTAIAFTKFALTSGIATITQIDNTLNANLPEDQFTFQWYRDGVLVAGDTTAAITVFQNGEYRVVASNLAGCSSTDTITVLSTGGQTLRQASDVKIYPNPSTGYFQLKFNSEIKSGIISVIDISGKLILEKQFNHSSTLNVDLTSLSKGIYFLKINTDNGIQIHKIIIQ